MCDDHATEISRLGFCVKHRKLGESEDMCEDCSSSSREKECSTKFAYFPWMKQIGWVENGDLGVKCSCCGEKLEQDLYSPTPYLLIKPSWELLDYTQKENLVEEDERSDFVGENLESGEKGGIQIASDEEEKREMKVDEEFSCFVSSFDCEHKEVAEDSVDDHQVVENDESSRNLDKHLEFFIDQDDCHLIPVELMDSEGFQSGFMFREEDQGIHGNGDLILDFDDCSPITPVELVVVEKKCRSEEVVALPSSPQHKDDSVEMDGGKVDLVEEEDEQVAITRELPQDTHDFQHNAATEGEMDADVKQVSDEQIDEIEVDVSIGTNIAEHEPVDDVRTLPSSCSAEFHADDTHGSGNYEEATRELNIVTDELSNQTLSSHLMLYSEFNDTEEDKVPDTPISIDSFHHLHKKLFLLERKESGAEESLDESVISDIEGGDGVLTVEKLKSALKEERKVLRALCEELEEERNASAVAASQTMAMINRLQEEKAAMQMEALQYQRMMEEQSEYDQEALQLLNELMVKREKEKAELEKELDVYRKRLQHHEAKEKMLMLRRSATSSASCSNAEDSDDLSVDLNQEAKEEDSFNQNTPADAVLCLDESLDEFEEERLSILEQLKVLEEKLVTMNDEEEQVNGNGYHEDSDFIAEVNGIANGHFNGNGIHHEQMKIPGPKAKRLLPLFDAESEDGFTNGHHENGFDSFHLHHSSSASFDSDNKKLAIEEEVDHVYDRLQALEADREFLKHCLSSLRKGDKGVHLLQEILQHLRDLRSVESRVRNVSDPAS